MNIFKRIQYNSPVTLTFALVSLAALGIAGATGGQSNVLLFSVYRSAWSDPLAYIRAFTHVLGHASMEHYFGNFMLILLLGPMIEEKYGSSRLLAMMAITAFATGILNILLFPQTMLLGASGIAFMLIILSSFVNLQRGRIPVTFLLVVGIFIGQEVMLGISIQDNISRLAHIAGGICGAWMGYYINRESAG
jgi:membrane associated rhomboid family serine protease